MGSAGHPGVHDVVRAVQVAISTGLLVAIAFGCTQRNDVDPGPGVTNFRGFGNEPGWSLTIDDSVGIRFAYDYGQTVVAAPEPARTSGGAYIRFEGAAAGDTIAVEIIREPCADTMSDETFDFVVSIAYRDRTFSGCGRES